ncbi:hypothetical protein U1Q18_029084 [Sarracenia purpurea var. burkii]
METLRLRVVFEDRHILSKSQRSEGLKRSWILLKTPHETISGLSSYLLHIFDLYRSCPNGIILSMDGFVLPPFESTRILKDSDVIRVTRKGEKLIENVKLGYGANLVEDEIVEKQTLLTGVPLLANEEFEKETGGYQSESEEGEHRHSQDTLHVENSCERNVVSKKRKAAKKLQSSRKKKRLTNPQATGNDLHIEQESCGVQRGKSIDKETKVSAAKSKADGTSIPTSAEKNNDIFEPLPILKRSAQLQENGADINLPQTPEGTKKAPSRSARRKKAKRQWLRELLKAEKRELEQIQSSEKDTHKSSIEHQVQSQNSEADDEIVADEEIVPIVIRPGHIRFEPMEKDQGVPQNQVFMETFQWNGITSKKKGQKWGKENFRSPRNDYKDTKKGHQIMTIEEVKPPNDPIDFDKLAPFGSLPKEGDVIAYRLLELSSTWTPVLSSFRVGRTSWYDSESDRVLLTPLPEYLITFDRPDEDACAQPPDDSLYGEDGSLEIEFSSLADVRIVKHGNSDSTKAVTGSVNDGSVGNEVAMSTRVPTDNDKQAHAPTPEKEVNAWDEISQALTAKKAQLIQENGWSKESSGRSPWSYRALRSSALGPTMAVLRARKDI